MKRFLNRVTVILLCLALSYYLLPVTGMAASLHPFLDVPDSHWANSAVEYVYDNNLMSGIGPNTFDPGGIMTRAMFVTVLGRMDGVNTASYPDTSFSDVPAGQWYSPYVAWASGQGIAVGIGGDRFSPNDPVTREQLAAMIARYVDAIGVSLPDADDAVGSFKDTASVSNWALDGLELMRRAGILSGYADGTFGPKKSVTRAEAATVFMRLCSCLDGGTLEKPEAPEEPEDPQLTESQIVEGKITTSQISDFGYLLYIPANAHENMPLIVYLHGGSGKGNDLSILTANAGFPQYLQDGSMGDIPAYVVIPQMLSSYTSWTNIGASVETLITEICENYGIDTNRISLTGHSMGGTGTWGMALMYPDLFSCIAPLSGSVTSSQTNFMLLKDMPVWAFVGSEDTIVAPESSLKFIAGLQSINSNASITVLKGATHFTVPGLAYLSEEYHLVEWLITNSK